MHHAITDVPGLKVGHYTDREAITGCTVILCEEGAVGGVDIRGAAPGTRETDLLHPMNLVQEIHAIVLSGGSAFGLDTASGVMRYLEERGVGFATSVARIPIVPAAILYDLALGNPKVRPGAAEGYRACQEAKSGPVAQGSVGAGTGATVGKILGLGRATKGGLGTASTALGRGIVVGALAVVNALGDVVDPQTGATVAGPRSEDGRGFVSTLEVLKSGPRRRPLPVGNTTLAVVATNAQLNKSQVCKLAQMAQCGLAQALRPAHTMADGDVVFALSLGQEGEPGDVTTLGAVAAEVLAQAIVRAIREAEALGGVPAVRDLA